MQQRAAGAGPSGVVSSSSTSGGGSRAPMPKGPVTALADAQRLLNVIMAYVVEQNALQPAGREASGYDLCKFKADFLETYR